MSLYAFLFSFSVCLQKCNNNNNNDTIITMTKRHLYTQLVDMT